MQSKKTDKLMANRLTWSLREVKKALSELRKNDSFYDDIGGMYPAINRTGGRTFLPQLRKGSHSVYNSLTGYEKRVDAFISKYGPEARFPQSNRRSSIKEQFTAEPNKENDNDGQVKSSKETADSDQEKRDAKVGTDQPTPEENPYSMTVDKGQPGVGHREFFDDENGGASANWDISLGDVNPGVKQSAELPNSQSQDNAYSELLKGDKEGFGPSPDALVSVSKEDASSGDKNGPLSKPEQSGKNGPIFRATVPETASETNPDDDGPPSGFGSMHNGLDPDAEPLGDVSSPLKFPSFGTFALSGVKGQRSWGLSKPSTKISLKDLIGSETLSSGLDESWLREDVAAFSSESKFRSGSPGGYVDANKAQLEKKSVKGQARKIARHFVGFFRDNEVGIGSEQTPRISGAKIVKEILGKSARLSRAKREEKGAGLKLILVDISPSCGAIRDACFAAALAIAEQDPDVVVIAHFNGYTARFDAHIVGHRQKEIPHIHSTSDLSTFEAFLAKGKIAGAVCFGDQDASDVYALLSRYCPTLWLSPDDESQCQYVLNEINKNQLKAYSKARMYIIGGVVNAQTAVEGLKKLKGKK